MSNVERLGHAIAEALSQELERDYELWRYVPDTQTSLLESPTRSSLRGGILLGCNLHQGSCCAERMERLRSVVYRAEAIFHGSELFAPADYRSAALWDEKFPERPAAQITNPNEVVDLLFEVTIGGE